MMTLGDDSTSSSTDFNTPEPDADNTDYGLQFSRNNSNVTRIANPYDNNSRKATARKSTARKQTAPKRKTNTPRGRKSQREVLPPTPFNRHAMTLIQRDQRFWKEVHMLRNRTDNLVPRAPFQRLVREVILMFSANITCITKEALGALQEASEIYLTQQFEDAYMLTVHRGRVTLMPRDMELLRVIRSHILFH